MAFLGIGKNQPPETDVPPPSIAPPPDNPFGIGGVLSAGKRMPPTYVYTQRREPFAGPTFTMAPDDKLGARFTDLNIGWHEAPDPIRQSPFYSAGNKIHPTAQMRVPSHTAFGSIEGVMQDRFSIGKLIGYFYKPMYAGMQHPSLIRSNIQEGLPSTYGSQYEVRGLRPESGIVSPTGFVVNPEISPSDGYPY